MRKTLATLLTLLALIPSAVFAQEPSAAPSTQAYLRSGAFREAIAREAARLGQSSAPAPSPQAAARRSWIARHPVKAGFLIGAAAGAVVGLASCTNAPEFAGWCTLAGFGSGGGGGALLGLALAKR